MEKEIQKVKCCHGNPAPQSAVYGLGFVGAAVYFIQHATTIWMGVLGVLKAVVWPAFLVYEAFKLLHY
jgi:hypothetical protein